MNIEDMKALAEILTQNALTAIEVSDGDYKIRLEKTGTAPRAAAEERSHEPAPAGLLPAVDNRAATEAGMVDFNHMKQVQSPMVGVFYAAPKPGEKPFVSVGDRVKKGTVLCIIEAMKLMNEIISEVDGEIADICVEDGQVVEFSQTLFKIF